MRILVTGASSGIGRGVAVSCSQMGASVLIVGRNDVRLSETRGMLHGEGHEQFICDLTDTEAVEKMVAELIRFSSSNPRITIPNAYATVMLSGIFMDTQYFKAKTTGIRTFEACTVLKDFGADNSKADDFLKDEFSYRRSVGKDIRSQII